VIYQVQGRGFWLDEVVDAFLEYAGRQGAAEGEPITLAAGMTPSCPIHFGIFREIALSYFVSEELKRRGRAVRLVFYWDDFDHFCKIPYFTTKSAVIEHVGKPLCEVPDLEGGYPSYGRRYMDVFERDLASLGIHPEYDYQSKKYISGAYAEYIRNAIRNRQAIFDIIEEGRRSRSGDEGREAFFPLEVYCASCRRDSVEVKSYDEAEDSVSYSCRACGHSGAYRISAGYYGKLMWKTNWATRWHDDKVLFESSGENQLTEKGSYAVSSRIVKELYGREAPFSLLYRFVGVPGTAKVSRALGEKGLSTRLVDLLEPAIARWLFLRNPPDKPFTIDLDGNLARIYHEWDAFLGKNEQGKADESERRVFELATCGVEYCPHPLPFRTLLIAIGVANGDESKVGALLKRLWGRPGTQESLLREAMPRIRCASKYVFKYGNRQDSPLLRAEMDADALKGFSYECRMAIRMLSAMIHGCSSEDDVAELLRSIPATVAGRREGDDRDPEPLKRDFYRALYHLLIGKDKGPKLSTLMHLAGPDTVLNLIKGEAIYEHIRYRIG
jgi:lysyl-tRNA synthetase class 1